MNRRRKADRNLEIFLRREEGEGFGPIAQSLGMTVGRARQIYGDELARRVGRDPQEVRRRQRIATELAKVKAAVAREEERLHAAKARHERMMDRLLRREAELRRQQGRSTPKGPT